MSFRKHGLVTVLSIFLIAFVSTSSFSDEHNEPMPYRIAVTDEEISVDGVLNEALWENALRIDLNYETSPGENVTPPVETEVFLIHNRGYLYVGFKAHDDNPEAIRAHLSDRDNIWGDDNVGIMIDTFNDELRAFQFECNPLGIQRDAMQNDAGSGRGRGGGDSSWDVIWDSAGQITSEGYVVEMAIPFNALSFPRNEGEQTWGIIASRDYPRSINHNIRNVPRDRNRNCSICQAAKIVGFEGISPGRNIEFTPTITGFRYDEREDFPDGKMIKQSAESDFGLSTKWGVTPNINLNVAVNPDFSQIEADAYQLEINRQFALRFEEKRPFFLEGRDIFGTPINAVYTRSVVDPSYGVKMTGKEGANALGVFLARDDVTHVIIPGSQGSESETLELESTSTVLRYRRDILENSTVGVLLSDREGGGYSNRVMGLDGRIRLTSKDILTFQAIGSNTDYGGELFRGMFLAENDDEEVLSSDTLSDWAHDIHYEHRTRNWNASVSHGRLGNDFRADVGHISRVGFERFHFNAGRNWYGDSSDLITNISLNGSYRQVDEIDGGLLEKNTSGSIRIRGAMQSWFNYSFNIRKQNFEDLEADLNGHNIRSSIRPFGDLRLAFNMNYGDAIDYRNVRTGSRLNLGPEFNLNIGRHFKINLDHEYTNFSVDSQRLYLANITQSRIVYQFSARMFLRSIFQYIDIRRNQDMYEDEIDPVSKRLFTQLLFSYKLNPRTVLFLGYSDNYRAYQDIDFTQSDRSVFMKIGYAWVL